MGFVSGLIVRLKTSMQNGRVIPFESTPNGWNLTVELQAPIEANSKVQEILDIMMTGKRLEQTEKIEHARGLPRVIKQMLIGRKDVSYLKTFRMAGTDLYDHGNDRWNR